MVFSLGWSGIARKVEEVKWQPQSRSSVEVNIVGRSISRIVLSVICVLCVFCLNCSKIDKVRILYNNNKKKNNAEKFHFSFIKSNKSSHLDVLPKSAGKLANRLTVQQRTKSNNNNNSAKCFFFVARKHYLAVFGAKSTSVLFGTCEKWKYLSSSSIVPTFI